MIKTNLEAINGNDNAYTITFSDANGAIDISGYTIYFTIKKKASDLDTAALFSADLSGTDLTDPTHGITVVEIPAIDSADLSGVLLYDIKYKDGDGKIGTVLYGNINCIKSITQRASVGGA